MKRSRYRPPADPKVAIGRTCPPEIEKIQMILNDTTHLCNSVSNLDREVHLLRQQVVDLTISVKLVTWAVVALLLGGAFVLVVFKDAVNNLKADIHIYREK